MKRRKKAIIGFIIVSIVFPASVRAVSHYFTYALPLVFGELSYVASSVTESTGTRDSTIVSSTSSELYLNEVTAETSSDITEMTESSTSSSVEQPLSEEEETEAEQNGVDFSGEEVINEEDESDEE